MADGPMDEVTVDLRPPLGLSASLDADPATKISKIPFAKTRAYTEDRQRQHRDWVRMVLTFAALFFFGWVIGWACFESTKTSGQWGQTKEMLLIILPAVTGLLGSVTGFYFGSESRSRPVDPVTGR